MNKNRLLKLEKRFNKKTPNELPIFAFTTNNKEANKRNDYLYRSAPGPRIEQTINN